MQQDRLLKHSLIPESWNKATSQANVTNSFVVHLNLTGFKADNKPCNVDS